MVPARAAAPAQSAAYFNGAPREAGDPPRSEVSYEVSRIMRPVEAHAEAPPVEAHAEAPAAPVTPGSDGPAKRSGPAERVLAWRAEPAGSVFPSSGVVKVPAKKRRKSAPDPEPSALERAAQQGSWKRRSAARPGGSRKAKAAAGGAAWRGFGAGLSQTPRSRDLTALEVADAPDPKIQAGTAWKAQAAAASEHQRTVIDAAAEAAAAEAAAAEAAAAEAAARPAGASIKVVGIGGGGGNTVSLSPTPRPQPHAPAPNPRDTSPSPPPRRGR